MRQITLSGSLHKMPEAPLSETCVCGGPQWHVMIERALWVPAVRLHTADLRTLLEGAARPSWRRCRDAEAARRRRRASDEPGDSYGEESDGFSGGAFADGSEEVLEASGFGDTAPSAAGPRQWNSIRTPGRLVWYLLTPLHLVEFLMIVAGAEFNKPKASHTASRSNI